MKWSVITGSSWDASARKTQTVCKEGLGRNYVYEAPIKSDCEAYVQSLHQKWLWRWISNWTSPSRHRWHVHIPQQLSLWKLRCLIEWNQAISTIRNPQFGWNIQFEQLLSIGSKDDWLKGSLGSMWWWLRSLTTYSSEVFKMVKRVPQNWKSVKPCSTPFDPRCHPVWWSTLKKFLFQMSSIERFSAQVEVERGLK